MRARRILTGALVAAVLSGAPAAELYVAPDGKPGNPGSKESPWDLASTLGGARGVRAGDTVYLLAGTYRRRPQAEYEIKLVGTADEPICVRPAPGARATIDGGLAVCEPSAHVWIRDLEILVSENFSMSREIQEPGSHPQSYGRPWGGLHMRGGPHCRYINLVIHDCAQGISSWIGAQDIEIYGCLIYENGWKAPDRGHGHSIYTQNRTGTKTIRHSILSAKYPGSYTMHAYGSSRAYVDNYLIEENVACGLGPFLVGGGRPSRNIRVLGNALLGVSMRIGYSAPHNENCDVRGNLIVDGGLEITRYRQAVREDNLVLARGERRPARTEVRWFPNKYDAARAHLVVCNWTGAKKVEVEAGPFLKAGDRYRLMDPKDIYGKPLRQGTCRGDSLTVPLAGECGAFVVFKEERE
jgi:hypothetical protein